jgi:nicotinamide-nucleotide amidase
MKAEVIAIGDELTTGQRLDTNSQWISAELAALGATVHFHTTATDSLEDGIEAFARAATRVDLVVATGGLGPTADDLTRDVLAAVSDRPLELSEEALLAVESRFARRGMPMPESNRLQAMFPRGSRIIANPEGTAPGIDLDVGRGVGAGGRCRIFSLPGVPSEMKRMWRDTVAPAILSMHPEAGTMRFRRIKCFGAGESAIEAMLPDLVRRGRDPLVGITAHEATITLRIAARGRDEAECLAKITPTERVIRDCLGPLVFGTDDDEIEDAAVAAVTARGWSLATVESATAGLVASLCMQADDRAGGGRYRGGRVLPAAHAGDAAIADAARRCRDEHAADVGLAVGPESDGPESGRSRVTIAMATPSGVETVEHVLGGAGSLRLSRAAKTALDLLRRTMP